MKGLHGLKNAGQLNYRLTGKLRVARDGMMSAALPFESEGQVTLNESGVGN